MFTHAVRPMRFCLPQFSLNLFSSVALAGLVVASFESTSFANGTLRDGAGARAMSLGGASVAQPDEPLEALHSNPAGLGLISGGAFQLGVAGGVAQGEFSNSANTNSAMREKLGIAPEFAVAYRLESVPVTLGLAFIPDAVASTDWKFVDAPGGLDGNTSYGLQRHHAEIINLRTALGAAWKVSDTLSIGVALGVEYDRNTLVAPYTFQSHPVLTGFKTLLDLETEGWGVNGTIGVVWQPCEKIHIGLSYRTATDLETDGDANGNAGVQLQNIGAGAFQTDFHYDAEVSTKLPQTVSLGVAYDVSDRWRVISQVDWINWSDSFDTLDIQLANGNNADINGFLGTDQIADSAPLNWRDRLVYRAGVEFAASESIALRAGYAYGANPIRNEYLTPMSAAILEHTVTGGAEWRCGRWTIGAAYQYSFPSEANVGTSALASGEYSNSSTQVEAHWFGVTTGVRF